MQEQEAVFWEANANSELLVHNPPAQQLLSARRGRKIAETPR